ncbi:protein ALP1-like [Manihot esculenta]|uniref:protein ALP1-like n=1 Tax=Manihot esculenta TaxID=3983 RepID=UPI000B5D2255|nr:protein ALP1-like [Manihot esculenta]
MAAAGGSSKSTAQKAPTSPKSTTKFKPRRSKNQNKHLTKQLISLLTSATSAAHSFLNQNDLLLLPSQSLTLEYLLSSIPFSSPPISLPSESFFYRFLSSASDFDPRWCQIFRMSKQTFSNLLAVLSPSLLSFLPPSIPPDSAIAATLFRLSHGASYESVARRFGLDSPAAACLAFYSVCKTVNEKLGDLVNFGRDLERLVVGFEWISLPNCCGVLGFGKFGVDSEVLGKNGSLLVQALVDSEGRFLDISAGWPCTMKPESIFSQTKLYSRVEGSNELLNGSCYQLSESSSIPQYILGDSCFPLLPWLLTPFIRSNEVDSFGSADREFNAAHNRAMGLVGNAFGRVKARWQLLGRRWKEDCVEFFPYVIVMGCLLHNFLIKYSEPLPEESVGRILREEELPIFEGEADERGERNRYALAKYLSRVSMRR